MMMPGYASASDDRRVAHRRDRGRRVERRKLGPLQVLLAARADADRPRRAGGGAASRGRSRYSNLPTSMLFLRSMTSPMVSGSMPRTMTPARFEALDAMTSPCDDRRRAASTPGTRADALERSRRSRPRQPPTSCRSTMCALLPRILRFRSWLKPPITLTTLAERARADSATPQIESTLMTVRKPLFCERTWRAATNDVKRAPLEAIEHATARSR